MQADRPVQVPTLQVPPLQVSLRELAADWSAFLAGRVRQRLTRGGRAERIAAIVAASGHPPGA